MRRISNLMQKKLLAAWYSKNYGTYFLLPFSYLYLFFFTLHKGLYFLNLKKTYRAAVPIIVIGNISVGGTGKTPLTIELSKILLAQGYRPGIVSRGYKGKANHSPQIVTQDSDPSWVGDEPVLIAKKTACPVVVARKRAKAIDLLLRSYDCNLIIADDGLQHHAIKKDVEILLLDSERQLGNGFCLPAGPLRESWKKIAKVDFLIATTYGSADNLTEKYTRNPALSSALNNSYLMTLQKMDIYNLLDHRLTLTPENFTHKRIHAVAGIANPQRFFSQLTALGLHFEPHVFPDHFRYKKEDFAFCQNQEVLIMTEKDAVKCHGFGRSNYWVLPIRVEMNERFKADFFSKLDAIKLASLDK